MASPLTVDEGLVPLNIPWKVSVMMYFSTLADVILYRWLPALAVSLIFFLLTWAVPRLLATIMRRIGFRSHHASLTAKAFRFILLLFGMYRVLRIMGFDPNYILTFFGLTSLALSWAMSPILRNYFAGFIIEWRDLVETDYCIEVNGVRGIVESCDTLNFVIYNYHTGRRIDIPNSIVLDSCIQILNPEESAQVTGPGRIWQYKDYMGHVHRTYVPKQKETPQSQSQRDARLGSFGKQSAHSRVESVQQEGSDNEFLF